MIGMPVPEPAHKLVKDVLKLTERLGCLHNEQVLDYALADHFPRKDDLIPAHCRKEPFAPDGLARLCKHVYVLHSLDPRQLLILESEEENFPCSAVFFGH